MWFIEHTNVAEKSISEIKSALDILNIHYDYFGFNKKENEIYFNNEVVADFFIVRPSIQALKYIIKNEEKNDFLSKLNSDIGYNEHNFDQNYQNSKRRLLPSGGR